VLSVAAVAIVQAALIPLAVSDASHPLQAWIGQFPLSIRLEQVPIDFALSSLYQSTIVNHALVLTLALAAVVIVLLVVSGDRVGVRGALIAAGLGAFVIFVPLLLAVFGKDYLVARNVIPAWLPLAILVAAACTAPRIVPAGAAIAVLLIGVFVYGLIDIERTPQYQRPDWRGVAAALGPARGVRAIAVYDGPFGAQPLSIYLAGVPWQQSTHAVTIKELDIVGNPYQAVRRPLPSGVTLIGSRTVHEFVVDRFSLAGAGWSATPAMIAERAGALLFPAPPGASLLVQRPA
jgi:hypothetical protein